ncbi:MAG: GTP-binding protein [Candidatus ainarchaeum sp.]|nr:GTP-binding protein [Candidatus ainarchaeum sp.]
MGIAEKIRELEDEIRRTQKNKATEYHIGLLKAKIAKHRRALISPAKSGSGLPSFDVKKNGDATAAIIGFPSVGKSTFLNKVTKAESKIAAYAFTTLTCIPGMLYHKGAKIQILDLPGIIEGAKDGRGRGREVIAVARGADLILMMLDAQHPEHYDVLVKELYGMGIRLNQRAPDVVIKKTVRGGVTINSTVKLTKLDMKTMRSILNEYGLHSGDVVIRQDIDVDQFIDVLEGNRVYLPAVILMNKIDLADEKELRKKFAPPFAAVSSERSLGLAAAVEAIYRALEFMRIYTKPRGGEADLKEPLIVRRGTKISDVCSRLHRDLLKEFRYALVWGKSVKHPGQRVGLDHVLQDGDILSIIKKY